MGQRLELGQLLRIVEDDARQCGAVDPAVAHGLRPARRDRGKGRSVRLQHLVPGRVRTHHECAAGGQ